VTRRADSLDVGSGVRRREVWDETLQSHEGVTDQVLAKLAVLGPTRMDYPGTMGAVRAVARYVGHILAES